MLWAKVRNSLFTILFIILDLNLVRHMASVSGRIRVAIRYLGFSVVGLGQQRNVGQAFRRATDP